MPTTLWRLLLTSLTLVLAGCSPDVLRSAPSTSLQALEPVPARASADETLAAHATFRRWLSAYFGADAAARQKLLGEGAHLAQLRRPLVKQLLVHEPELALTLALSPTERNALPEPIAHDVERWRDGRGMLHVIEALGDDAESFDRFVTFRGSPEVLRAGVFGRRLGQLTRDELRLHGVELDGVIALTQSPLRAVLSGEDLGGLELRRPAPCPVSRKRALPELLFNGGDELFGFCTPLHAETFAAALSSSEDVVLDSAWTEGAKTVLFIRVDFSDRAGDPISQAAAETLINTQVNQFYRDNSFSKTSLSTTVTPTLRLPRTQADYRATDNYVALMSDAYAAATAAGFPTANYNLPVIAFASTFSGWAGRGYVGSRGSWLNGSFSLRVTAHELGHNYGVYHANFWNAGQSVIGAGTNVEYGNPFDVMGGGGGAGNHFNAWFKRTFDWVTASEVLTVASSGTYRVSALEQPIATGLHGLKIRRDAQRDYWVEFRQALTGNTMLMNGASVIFGYGYNTGSHLLDLTPDDGSRTNSPLVIGQTLSDPLAGIYLTPIGKGGTTPESLDVVVNLGTFPGNRAPTLSLAASATSVASNTAVTFTATAVDPDGDPLAYAWEFDDGTLGTNAAVQTKTLSAQRVYNVRCTVSDMKGQSATASVNVTVGTPTLFTLQGSVTAGGQPLGGARVTDGTRWTTTAGDGTWTLTQVPAGSYTVAAWKFDYTFTRGFAAPLAVTGSMTGLAFTGTARPGYQVRGRVTAAGVAIAGVVVTDGTRSATSNSAGDYALSTVPNGRYTLSATAPGWQFSPSGFTNPLEVYGGDVTTANFIASGQFLSGTIPNSVATAPVVTDGVRSSTATSCGANWCWSMNGVPNGDWNLVATSPGVTLTPANFTNPVTVAGASRSNLNFQAVATVSYLVSGTARTGATPLPGVVVSDGTRTATTDSLGRYTLVGVPPGTFTLTATRAGYTFVPPTLSVTVVSANLTGRDFTTAVVNAPPTIVTPAAASPTPTTATTTLSVLGADDGGEAALTYAWAATGSWPVAFSANGSNAAKAATATFSGAGTYTLEVTVTDAGGLSVRSSVVVTVTQVATALAVSPASANVMMGATQFFSAQLRDQFGRFMFAGAPTWSVSGGGTIATNGVFTAGATPGGPFTVTTTVASLTATGIVTVIGSGAPTIVTAASCTPTAVTGTTCVLSVLGADDGGEPALTYAWSSTSGPAPVTFSANGTNAAKSVTVTFQAVGTYQLVVTVQDAAANTIASSATVQVSPTPTSIDLSPASVSLQPGEGHLFAAAVRDQFGAAISPQPAVTWTVSGGGAVDTIGFFTAGATPGGPFTLTAQTGGLTATAQITISAAPDTSPPAVSITAPLPGAVVGGVVTVVALATDNVGVTRVEFFSDAVLVGEATAPPFELAVDTTALSDGAHALTARASAAAGNATLSDEVVVTVSQGTDGGVDGGADGGADAGVVDGGADGGAPDGTPPTVRITAPADGAEVALEVPLIIEAGDDVGVTRVDVELDGALVETLAVSPWVTTITVSEGAHQVVAIASDAAGNQTRSAPVSFTASAVATRPLMPDAVVGSCGCAGTSGAPLSLALVLVGLSALGGWRRQRRASASTRGERPALGGDSEPAD